MKFELTEKHLDAALATGFISLSSPLKEALKDFDLIGDRQKLRENLTKEKALVISDLEELYDNGLHDELRQKLPFVFEWEEEPHQFTEEEEQKLLRVEGVLSGSEQWLRRFCETNDCPSYEIMMEVINSPEDSQRESDDYGWSKDDQSITFYGRDAHADIPDEFWDHVENVTGKRFNQNQRPRYFSCSC
jgi:hypothetical protein